MTGCPICAGTADLNHPFFAELAEMVFHAESGETIVIADLTDDEFEEFLVAPQSDRWWTLVDVTRCSDERRNRALWGRS